MPDVAVSDLPPVAHRSRAELEAGLARVRQAPWDAGSLKLIVRRPAPERRELLTEALLDPAVGLVGDGWLERGSRGMPDGTADPRAQLTIMNVRFAALIGGEPEGWALAGDQLYVDLDLAEASLPAGSRLLVGPALLEISELPHTGCAKFSARFGSEALRLANSPEGRALRLRGLNARVLEGGIVRLGDIVRRPPAR